MLQLRDGEELKVGVLDGGYDDRCRVLWRWPVRTPSPGAWKSWENFKGNHGKTMAKPWENHGNTMETPWKHHGKTMEKPMETYGNLWKAMENLSLGEKMLFLASLDRR